MAACLLLLIVVACAGGATAGRRSTGVAPASAAERAQPTLTLADSGRAVTVAIGGALVVELPSRGDAGYRWHLAWVDRTVLDLASPPVIERDDAAQASDRVFSFTALHPGSTHLEIALRRPWESGPSARTFTLEVTVKGTP